MNRKLVYGVALCMAGMVVCGSGTTENTTMPEPSEYVAAEATNQFAMDLYQRLRHDEGNLFFSPYSITSALAMTWAGARGETAAEMAETLRFGVPEEAMHEGFKALNALVNAPSDAVALRVANALWGQMEYEFLQEYLDLVETHYGGALETLDFVHDPDGSRQIINAWVEDKTEDRIKDLLPEGSIDPLTRLVLTNAIYFKGTWEHEFNPDQTRDEPFYLLDGTEVEVPMMHQRRRFPYAENEAVHAVRLPYQGGDMSMLVLLPKERDGLPAIEANLDTAYLDDLIDQMRMQEVRLGLPRFTTTSDFSMAQMLRAMGMPRAFNPEEADFSGMTGDRELYISDVIHKAFIEVNEEGTEAAAATGVTMRATSAMPQEPVEFIVDRPFLLVLRHEPSGAMLFVGRIVDPRD